jgi:hypothetical protein
VTVPVAHGDSLNFTVVRQTIRQRLQAKLGEVKAELKRRMHDPSRKWVNGCARWSRDTFVITVFQ